MNSGSSNKNAPVPNEKISRLISQRSKLVTASLELNIAH